MINTSHKFILPVAFPADQPTYKFHTAAKNGTLISVVLDESGSMASCLDTTISGFNEFVQSQRSAENIGEAYMTLIKFDSPLIKTVYTNKHINEVPLLDKTSYRPNGMTNLLDAVGKAINSANSVLESVSEEERPGILIVIMTDGQENASKEYNNIQIKEMVKAAEAADWTFIFLGANIDSFVVGSTFGMNIRNTVNYNTNNMTQTYSNLSDSTTAMRRAKMAGMPTMDIYASGLATSGFDKKED